MILEMSISQSLKSRKTPTTRRKLSLLHKFSYGQSSSDNMIIQSNNGDALDVLESKYTGKIKCIYIDPPYNNGEKYTHYNDDLGHDVWLKRITKTLTKLRPLLTSDGSIWISIDDNELHYLKVAADKVFGRENFISTIVWQQRTTRENRKVFSNNHEYILVYSVNPIEFKASRNLLPPTQEILERYNNPDNDPRGLWQSISANVQAGHATPAQFYTIKSPHGKEHKPPNGRCWVYNEARMKQEIQNNNIWFGKNGTGVPRIKKFLNDARVGLTPETLWTAEMSGTNLTAKKHMLELFPNKTLFDTPKPEQLLERIFNICTNEGDLVLDAYLGSGTTAAVAHKMGRKYIGIESGNHVDLAIQRLKKVIDGEKGGISQEVKWSGGGGLHFFKTHRV